MAKYQSKESVVKHARPTDNAFLTELRQFHESRGTPFRGTPSLNGRVVNLSVLYHQVTALGGWRKVNDSQKWDTVVSKLNFPRSCANAGLALKQFYIRYLDHYEKIHFLGEDPDDDGLDGLDHPSRKTQSIAYLVPLSYNHHQHEVSESVRNQCGLTVDFSSSNDYDKLSLSLQSGFPNEVDFALNVCTLLSNEGRHTLKLQKNPRLVDLLISHAGVWTESNLNLKEHLEQQWEKTPGRQMSKFWNDLTDGKELKDLYCSGLKKRVDDGVFNCGRELGLRENEGQRVLQIANILWNLSFEDCNVPVIASSPSCLKFLFLCINAKWWNLRQLALETLGNIAGDINLEPVNCLNTQVVFRILAQCLGSSDRFLIIRGLEILTGLCKVENNEETIIKSLERKTYERICNLLTLHDIMILIYTLECLYHLTDLGADVCSNIVRIHKVIEILINLVTVEAQSYGPSACISMKVIETAPPPVQPVVSLPTNQRPQPAPPPTQRIVSPASVHGYQEADNDTFAYNWLKAYYEWHSGGCVSQNELYVNYQTTCNKLGKKGLVPPSQLLNLLKSLYPQLKTRQEGIRSDVHLEGIRRRAVTLPVSIYMPTTKNSNNVVNPSVSSPRNSKCNVGMSNSPILKAQLSAPPRGSGSSASSTSSGTANNHPHLQQALLGRSQPSAVKPTAATPPSTTRSNVPSKDSSTLIKSLLANKVNQNMLLKKQQQQSSNGEATLSTVTTDTDGRLVKSISNFGGVTTTTTTTVILGKEYTSTTTSPVRPRSPKSRVNGATTRCVLQLDDNRMFQMCANVEQAKDVHSNSSEFHGSRIERVENHLDKRRTIDNEDEPTLDKLLRSSGVKSVQNGVLTSSTSQQNGNRSESDSPNFVTMEASPPLGTVAFVETTSVRRKGVLADLLEGKVHKDTLLTMNGIVDRNNKSALSTSPPTTTTNLVFATKSVPRTNGDNGVATITTTTTTTSVAVTSTVKSITSTTTTSTTTSSKTVKVILPVSSSPSSAFLTDWSSLPSASKVIVPNKCSESEELIGFPRVSMEQLNQLRQQSKAGKRPGETIVTGHEVKRTRSITENVAKECGKASSPILSASEVQQQVSAALSFAESKSPTVVAVSALDEVSDDQCQNLPTSSLTTSRAPEVTTLTTTTTSSSATSKFAVAIKSEPNRRNEKSHIKVDFICEWKDCMKSFNSPMAVFVHACKSHVPENLTALCCLWESCDQMSRQRLSLMTHLQDRHCNDNMLRLQATRRQQLAEMGSSTIPPPAPPPPHPGYAPNAAVQAIRRHALEFMAQKEKLGADEKEGPVTKSIRLTSALILRNLVMYSALARSMVKKYESNLSIVAMSNVESSRTVAQCLWELNRQHDLVHVR